MSKNPDAPTIYAFADMKKAVDMDEARHQVKMIIAHDKPINLTPSQLSQRNQILGIAEAALKKKAYKLMDSACNNWLNRKV